MTSYKVFMQDIRCGLLRFRYLGGLPISAIPLLHYFRIVKLLNLPCSWMDSLAYLLKGCSAPSFQPGSRDRITIPAIWIFVICGILVMNIDYLISDLTRSGQQIIVRCQSRKKWYLSKCLWAVLSSCLYFGLLMLFPALFSIIGGGTFVPRISLQGAQNLLGINTELTSWQSFVAVILLPLLTISALNMLQMTMGLFVNPILSFIICLGILVISVCWDNPCWIGNGAMTIRTVGFVLDERCVVAMVVSIGILIAACCLIGCIRFSNMDILPRED